MSGARHILLVSNTAYSLWNFRRDVIRDMLLRGLQVTCTAADDQYADHLRDMGVRFVAVPMSRSGMNPLAEIYVIVRLWRDMFFSKPDFVISYTIKPNCYVPFLARLLGVPCLAVVTGLGYAFLMDNYRARLARMMLMCGLLFAHYIWFLNSDDKDTICGESRILQRRADILPGEGIDTDVFDDTLFPDVTTSKFTFLMIARLLKDKGIYEFAEAARLVKLKFSDAEFQVLGGFDPGNPAAIEREEWDNLCAQSGIVYLGTAADVRPLIAAASVCVLPSYREGVPLALLEAASMRRPLIATDVAGCRDVVVPHVTGFLVKPYDAQALADAMMRMMTLDQAQFNAMKESARRDVAARFGSDIIISRYQKILATVCE